MTGSHGYPDISRNAKSTDFIRIMSPICKHDPSAIFVTNCISRFHQSQAPRTPPIDSYGSSFMFL